MSSGKESTLTRALHLDEIAIRRMPGIPDGFTVDGLSPSINIVFGPNAAGKTTLARAVQTLLWPRRSASDSTDVSARFRLDGRSWRLTVNGSSSSCERDGQPINSPVTAPGDGRYLLALHDLLAADNSDFAAHIARESSGGYDIGAAISQLKYQQKPSPAHRVNRELQQSREQKMKVRQASEALVAEERRLQDLRFRLAEAQKAAESIGPLHAALDYQRAVADHERAKASLTRFPESCGRLRDDTLETLKHLRDELEQAREQLRAEQQSLRDSLATRDATKLGDVGLPSGFLVRLRARVDELNHLSTDAQRLDELMRAAHAEQDRARAAIGNVADDDQLAGFTVGEISQYASLAEQLERTDASLRSIDEMLTWLAPISTASHAEEIARLGIGVSQLNQWLREGQNANDRGRTQVPAPAPVWPMVLGIVAILETLLLAIVGHPALLVLIVIPIALLVLHRHSLATPSPAAMPEDHRRMHLEESFERLALDEPVHWETSAVEALVDALNSRRISLLSNEEKRQRWKALPAERDGLRQQLDALHVQRLTALSGFGLPPGTSTLSLVALTGLVALWQEAAARLAGAEAVSAATEQRRTELLASLADDIAAYGYSSVSTVADVVGAADDLTRRDREWSDATAAIDRHERGICERLEPDVHRRAEAVKAFFAELDLDDGDESALYDLVGQLADWKSARQQHLHAEAALRAARERLGADESLAGLPQQDIEDRLAEAEQSEHERERLRDDISAIEARIDEAKRRSDMEQAIDVEARQMDRLRDARASNQSTGVGWLLGDHVRQRTRDRDRPAVFHRAQELFLLITQGRYQLEIDDAEPPRFSAIDTTTGAGHSLNELSSGTRLQLLISVRIAFVEQQEQGPKLPLLLDETLGNSDERRAKAIIDAAVQLARDGRQIFYFTAQHDEVDKWRQVLCEHSIEHHLIDLVVTRRLAESDRLPLVPRERLDHLSVPAPNGHDRSAYADLLGVPDIDPRAPIGGVHLWHVVEDLNALHRLLDLGITTWGQFAALDGVSAAVLSEHEDALAICRIRAAIIETVLDCWRVGRGKLVERSVLRASGHLSSAFFERVCKLADELNGNPDALVAALDSGQIRGFRSQTTADLRAYFEDHGYIDPTSPISSAEARFRALSVARRHALASSDTEAWIGGLVTVLWQDAAS